MQGGTWASSKWYDDELHTYLDKYAHTLASMSLHHYSLTHCSGRNVTRKQMLSWRATQGNVEKLAEAQPVSKTLLDYLFRLHAAPIQVHLNLLLILFVSSTPPIITKLDMICVIQQIILFCKGGKQHVARLPA